MVVMESVSVVGGVFENQVLEMWVRHVFTNPGEDQGFVDEEGGRE